MDEENKPNLEDWTDFAGEWLKTDIVKKFPVKIVVKDVGADYSDEGKPKMWVVTEYLGRSFKLGLNKTNQNFLKANNLMPREVIGKILTLDKIKVRDPSKNALVDSFCISSIEKA